MNSITQLLVQGHAVAMAFVTGVVDSARTRDERGVVSIEYLVLGAALIVLIAVIGTNSTVQTALQTAFSNLFTSAGGGGA